MNTASSSAAYHLVGIGGIGMSAIARLLLRRGAFVSGSDERPSSLLDELMREGARVAIGHRADNVGRPDAVVVSSAIAPDNPEYAEARRCGIPIITRGEMLARIIGTTPTVAVAGTHGKTTTTAMVATIFETAGLDPSVAVGGQRIDAGSSNARSGGGAWFITESDESDGSFLRLSPRIAVVTNIENDHIASDAELPRLVEQFVAFLAKLPADGAAIVGIDNPRSAALVPQIAARVTTFAAGVEADVQAVDIVYPGLGARFTLLERGVARGEIELAVPGVINVQNALAAIAVARRVDIPFAVIAAALAAFRGVRRRFEIVGRCAALTVVDDYAHHPTAVAQTIAAARALATGAVIVAFQPHRYSRTAYLAADFARALAGADAVYLTPIYAAGEAPLPGVSERSIGEPLAAAGVAVTYAPVEELAKVIRANAPRGALVLMLGAGSISTAAHRFGAAIDASPVAAG